MGSNFQADPKMSESAEMYLISIARLIEHGAAEPIALSDLANELSIQPVSVNEMVHKLEAEGSLAYEPYQGVKLTEAGHRIADRVLRSRRLWESFLVERLGVPPGEADALACRFEHVTPAGVVDRLEGYLGRPDRSVAEPGSPSSEVRTLAALQPGQAGRVVELAADEPVRRYLVSQGMALGAGVRALAVADDSSLVVEVEGGNIALTTAIARQVRIESIALEGARE